MGFAFEGKAGSKSLGHECRDDTVSTENLTTLYAVVPKTGKGEWLGSYEQLSDFVVRLDRLMATERA